MCSKAKLLFLGLSPPAPTSGSRPAREVRLQDLEGFLFLVWGIGKFQGLGCSFWNCVRELLGFRAQGSARGLHAQVQALGA